MNEDVLKKLKKDEDGLATYEYIANNIGSCDGDMPELVDNIIKVDRNGQFIVSTARYLAAIDKEKYSDSISKLLDASIEKDRDRKYMPSLLASIWGEDYVEKAEELSASDNNFRRIYKRVYPKGFWFEIRCFNGGVGDGSFMDAVVGRCCRIFKKRK